ncbi:unnamed protein product [Pelagomonas calceolata]|uniref:Uncharacterized protein n=1 Tax=Pelagomonas calceolata TaxID=35677 RepID=A0A8J2S351_9STRA|nr:unnamed protein product [Pelagomonas calceolata]|mmetsp:Transcript_6014/g.17958  ORF Transcript_6014/g.17958 Transcript_6014/m.17958 type:complete len:284 (+) Transcript_6014:97-948(+)
MYRLICFVAISARAFVAGPHKALHSACTSSKTPSTRRRRNTCRRAKADADDAVEDLIRRARALRADAAQTEAALVEETVLDDESAANYADELGLADAVLEERRKEARKLAAEMLKQPEDKSKWPKFSGNNEAPEEDDGRGLFGAALQGGVLDNVFGGPAPRFELTAEKMEDPELQSVVRRQMVDAFDNRREDEVDLMFARLWHAGPIKTVKKLVEAVLDAQDVYQAYSDDLLSDERAADEIRCCRSRIRMYAKDAEFLPNADGSPASDTWGSLDDFIPWRWRP